MSRGTPIRHVRVEETLWTAAQSVAAERNETLSDIIRAALVAYIQNWGNR